MSANIGLAASPDPSHDAGVLVSTADERAVHAQIINEAYLQVQRIDEAQQYSDREDDSQQTFKAFDFSRRDLETLPVELVDVIGQHAERLALGWNRLTDLSTFGVRFGEFTSLKYLVMRNNLLHEFPEPVS